MKTQQIPTKHMVCALSLMLAAGITPLAADTSSSSDTTRASTSATSASSGAASRSMSDHGQLKRSDRRFVEKIGKLGMEEVALSRLAAERASNPDVRSFAQMLVTAHEKVNTELNRLASTKGVMLPMDDRPNLDKWSKKDAKDFDKDYLEKMIDAHEDSIELLESNARKAEDTELAAFARTNLPAMQEHLRKAQDLQRQLK